MAYPVAYNNNLEHLFRRLHRNSCVPENLFPREIVFVMDRIKSPRCFEYTIETVFAYRGKAWGELAAVSWSEWSNGYDRLRGSRDKRRRKYDSPRQRTIWCFGTPRLMLARYAVSTRGNYSHLMQMPASRRRRFGSQDSPWPVAEVTLLFICIFRHSIWHRWIILRHGAVWFAGL